MLWSDMYGLRIRVNGLEINSTFTKTQLPEVISSPTGLTIGCDISGSQCTPLLVDDVSFAQNIEHASISRDKVTSGLLLNLFYL